MKTARRAARLGGTYTTVLNAANESCVRLFLERRISFLDIFRIVEEEVALHSPLTSPEISEILDLDREIKRKVLEKYKN